MHPATNPTTKPKLVVGWIIAADLRDQRLLESYEHARTLLLDAMCQQFPMFDWRMPLIERRSFAPRGSLRPLPLLELGGEEKLHRHWDYALVLVPNELEPRRRISTLGVPSSALEVAVLSSAHLGDKAALPERLAGLAQHLLGHLLTLESRDEGPMRPPDAEQLRPGVFPEDQATVVVDVLQDAADARLEERKRRWNIVSFYWRSFRSDGFSILKSIIGYKPWRIPLYLGRLTAAVAVSLLFLLLTAESWEAGAHMQASWVFAGTIVSILTATVFIFFGQHLDQVGRGRGWSEQLARSRIVLFGTLLLGMLSLWTLLFGVLLGISFALPRDVIAGWSNLATDSLPRLKYVSFMASIGILAAALGGNLEEEDAIKAELFYDDEV